MQPTSPCRLVPADFLFSALVATARADEFSAIEHQRRTIYHSPQKPRFTSWISAWTMLDGSLIVSFTQATGPVESRPRAPKEVQHKLTWPPPGLKYEEQMARLCPGEDAPPDTTSQLRVYPLQVRASYIWRGVARSP